MLWSSCLVVHERGRQQLLTRLVSTVHVVLLRRPIHPSAMPISRSSPCWSDSSTAPRPRGTVAVAQKQGPLRGYVLLPLAAPHHRREGRSCKGPRPGQHQRPSPGGIEANPTLTNRVTPKMTY